MKNDAAFAPLKTIKTALKISIINFYFVTVFYCLYYICMGFMANDKKLVTH